MKLSSVLINKERITDSQVVRFIDDCINGKVIDNKIYGDNLGDTVVSLWDFADENGIDLKKVIRAASTVIPIERQSQISTDFCNFVEDAPESLDDKIWDTVAHGPYDFETAVEILDKLLTDEEKNKIIKKLKKSVK